MNLNLWILKRKNLNKINFKEINLIVEDKEIKKIKDFKEKDLIGNQDNLDNKNKFYIYIKLKNKPR